MSHGRGSERSVAFGDAVPANVGLKLQNPNEGEQHEQGKNRFQSYAEGRV